jgi:hypothetical protein
MSHSTVHHLVERYAPKPELTIDANLLFRLSPALHGCLTRNLLSPTHRIKTLLLLLMRGPHLAIFLISLLTLRHNHPVLLLISHTLNMPNYEPHHRSFFRNLAQNVFPHKDKYQNLAEIEDGAYPLAQLEHDTTNIKNIWLLRMMFIWNQTR